ncbi:hypothetical protein [Novipirellula artificiosorum]|uniref:hypothetical protein n=1 Tax=Novipirellula artificiosorum TaxID=2528016 RepID=UPI0011B51130|nr:hypothetical protein [Novipirellula artificiosorum]
MTSATTREVIPVMHWVLFAAIQCGQPPGCGVAVHCVSTYQALRRVSMTAARTAYSLAKSVFSDGSWSSR